MTLGHPNIKRFMQTLLDRMVAPACTLPGSPAFHLPITGSWNMFSNVPWQMKYRNGVRKIPVAGCLCRSAATGTAPGAKKARIKKTDHPATNRLSSGHAGNPKLPYFLVLPLWNFFKTEAIFADTKGWKKLSLPKKSMVIFQNATVLLINLTSISKDWI